MRLDTFSQVPNATHIQIIYSNVHVYSCLHPNWPHAVDELYTVCSLEISELLTSTAEYQPHRRGPKRTAGRLNLECCCRLWVWSCLVTWDLRHPLVCCKSSWSAQRISCWCVAAWIHLRQTCEVIGRNASQKIKVCSIPSSYSIFVSWSAHHIEMRHGSQRLKPERNDCDWDSMDFSQHLSK